MVLGFYIVSFTLNPIWGGIADHYGRKIMVLRATLGMGFFMTVVPFAPTPLWFACLIMLVGVFNGSTAASMALLVANTPARRIGSALSIAQTGTLVGQTAYRPAFSTKLSVLRIVERQRDDHEPVLVAALPSSATNPGAKALWVGAIAIVLAALGLIAMPIWGRILDHCDPARGHGRAGNFLWIIVPVHGDGPGPFLCRADRPGVRAARILRTDYSADRSWVRSVAAQ
jgi:Major Facilitator Superfamily